MRNPQLRQRYCGIILPMKSSRTDWSSAARIRNDAEKGSGAVVADIDILLQRDVMVESGK